MKSANSTPKTPDFKATHDNANVRLYKMSIAALGIVFGDISTSPIYAIRECFHGEYGISPTHGNIIGVLSLMFWSLVMIVSVKYLIFVFRADNKGEGGVIALTALIRGETNSASQDHHRLGIVAIGLFAACLLYGDGMITPAISVLSAVEGIGIVTPMFDSYIIPLTILILCALFLIQRHGTARVGGLFGPVILIWLCFLAVTGVFQIIQAPQVLQAVYPWHAVRFLIVNKLHGFMVLGAVFLVVTGTEALYADMGHFGTRPIRLTWFAVVFPALVSQLFRTRRIAAWTPRGCKSSLLRHGSFMGHVADRLLSYPGHHNRFSSGDQWCFFADPSGDSTGISAPRESPAHIRCSNGPDISRSGQLVADGVYDRLGDRVPVIE